MNKICASTLAVASGLFVAACGGMPTSGTPMGPMFTQDGLPDAVKVPGGHRVVLETVGVGEITYECRARANTAGAFEWVFVGPKAELNSRSGKRLGTYFGPPATWAANDGSAITGAQLAVSPNGAGNIPLQLVKANPATGKGAMSDIAYVQRVATRGGVAPAMSCDAGALGRKEVVKYQSDYVFWKTI